MALGSNSKPQSRQRYEDELGTAIREPSSSPKTRAFVAHRDKLAADPDWSAFKFCLGAVSAVTATSMASAAKKQSDLWQRGICSRWPYDHRQIHHRTGKAGERDPRLLADSALLYLSRQRLSRTLPPNHLP